MHGEVRHRTRPVISGSDADQASAYAKRLVAQILTTEDRERQRLASSLYDGPLQELACARLALARWVQSGADAVSEAHEALTRAIAQLRDVVFDLYPPALEALGLEAALRDLIEAVVR